MFTYTWNCVFICKHFYMCIFTGTAVINKITSCYIHTHTRTYMFTHATIIHTKATSKRTHLNILTFFKKTEISCISYAGALPDPNVFESTSPVKFANLVWLPKPEGEPWSTSGFEGADPARCTVSSIGVAAQRCQGSCCPVWPQEGEGLFKNATKWPNHYSSTHWSVQILNPRVYKIRHSKEKSKTNQILILCHPFSQRCVV